MADPEIIERSEISVNDTDSIITLLDNSRSPVIAAGLTAAR